MIIKAYAHCDKDTMYERGKKAGLKGEALDYFMYALYEVEFELNVDQSTGSAEIVAVDGRKLAKRARS